MKLFLVLIVFIGLLAAVIFIAPSPVEHTVVEVH